MSGSPPVDGTPVLRQTGRGVAARVISFQQSPGHPRLRAPLTSIIDSTTTLLQACPGLDLAEMLELYRIIQEQANHMRGLLADLLDHGASRRAIEETAVVGHGRPASLSSVVNARPAAVARGVAGLGGAPAPLSYRTTM